MAPREGACTFAGVAGENLLTRCVNYAPIFSLFYVFTPFPQTTLTNILQQRNFAASNFRCSSRWKIVSQEEMFRGE